MEKKFVSIALILASFCAPVVAAEDCRSEGARIGIVQKFSNKGVINKSWEGELIMGGIKARGESQTATNVWAFSTLDPAIAKQIEDSLGETVRVKYCKVYFSLGKADTKYRVTEVTKLAK